MLNFFFLKKNLFNFFQSGFYIDFIIKKIAELFIKNVYIYVGIFFCEKFIVEFISKKTIDNFIFLSKCFLNTNFFFESFFSQIVFILFYFIFFLEFFYILV